MVQAALPLGQLTPGPYEIVAQILSAGKPIATVRRAVVIGK
jgi:hypothetical protein